MNAIKFFNLEDQALADYRAAQNAYWSAWNAGHDIGRDAINAARARLDAIRAKFYDPDEHRSNRYSAIDHARLALDDA